MADQLLAERRLQHNGHVPPAAVVSSAAVLTADRQLLLTVQPWQQDVWGYFHTLGTFRYAILWHAQTMSRVRLTVASVVPGGGEPVVMTEGAAVDLMRSFFGGTAGQSQYLSRMDTQIQCAGEGFVVAEEDEVTGDRRWSVVSIRQLRVTSRKLSTGAMGDLWEMQYAPGMWRVLGENTLVFRQWHEDAEYNYLPDSPARAALADMRIIDMLQRRIVAQAVSRLAANGILLYPNDAVFPVNPKYKDEPDPFSAELLDLAKVAIAEPGSATAAMPFMLKLPAELIEKWRHLDFSNPFDQYLLPILEFAYDRLATAMNMPKEVVSGMGDTSHWNAWTLDEQGVELHIKPPAEELCAGITRAWLHPALLASGEPITTPDGAQIVCWYDTGQLDVPPDRSAAADSAFDRQMISPRAYRREKGFSEADQPTKDEMALQLELQLAKDPASAPTVIKELTGQTVSVPAPAAGTSPPGPGGEQPAPPAPQPAPAAGPPTPPSADAPQPAKPA
jgi:hypothetical protein